MASQYPLSDNSSLQTVAKAMMAKGRGVLAADESTGTLKKRFNSVGVDATEENGRIYRQFLFTTDDAEKYISSVIMFDTTFWQKADDGTRFVDVLKNRGIIPGIKVDIGAKPLALAPGELVTEGLDDLADRLKKYRANGARFAKWRAVISIDDKNKKPSDYCIHVNAHALARYAALCVDNDIVPIVEPEVLMDGDHTIDTCYKITEQTLSAVYEELRKQTVPLDQTLLKPNMVISGMDCPDQASADEIAEKTIKCFKNVVPDKVPGIVFLSGGQTEAQASANLNAICASKTEHPWPFSFSYGRALQASALKTWSGNAAKIPAAKAAYLHRAKLNGTACLGKYTRSLESQ